MVPLVVSRTTGSRQPGRGMSRPVAVPLKSWAVPWVGAGSSRRWQATSTALESVTRVLIVTRCDIVPPFSKLNGFRILRGSRSESGAHSTGGTVGDESTLSIPATTDRSALSDDLGRPFLGRNDPES